MPRKSAPKPDRHQSLLVALRLAPAEKEVMLRLIERAEHKAGMVPGTLSAAAYSRSAVLDYMARQLAAIEAAREDRSSTEPPAWEVITRAGEILRSEGSSSKK
jgi:hypothetical protein